jgi:hypothetical protein
LSRLTQRAFGSYKETWTTGATHTVTHNLGTSDVLVVARDIDTGEILTIGTGWGQYEVGVTVTSTNAILLTAAAAPTGSGIRIAVLPL